MQIFVEHPDQLPEVAQQLVELMGESKVCLFYGEMGAGKTTLIKSICAVLGVEDTVSSPTFSIVNEYDATNGTIYHFDFYRLRNEQEAFDMGYEEYFYSDRYCFIEWPERIPNLLPEGACKIEIKILGNEHRQIILS